VANGSPVIRTGSSLPGTIRTSKPPTSWDWGVALLVSPQPRAFCGGTSPPLLTGTPVASLWAGASAGGGVDAAPGGAVAGCFWFP
jgi:hypothetical protein